MGNIYYEKNEIKNLEMENRKLKMENERFKAILYQLKQQLRAK